MERVTGERRDYGACDLVVIRKWQNRAKKCEGMLRGSGCTWPTYKIKLTNTQREMFEAWSKADPVDEWERLRDRRIEAIQGK
jgi:deoxyribonuclease-1